MNAVLEGHQSTPGVADVFRAEQLADRPATHSPLLEALADSYWLGRSGDLFIVPKPYWLMDGTAAGKARSYGTGHGTPYNYDQHVPVLFMGFGIRPGEYHGTVTLLRTSRRHSLRSVALRWRREMDMCWAKHLPRRPPPGASQRKTKICCRPLPLSEQKPPANRHARGLEPYIKRTRKRPNHG